MMRVNQSAKDAGQELLVPKPSYRTKMFIGIIQIRLGTSAG